MFGLEGSGFVVSLAMTFFLVGLVMYYVRVRINEQENQLNQLVSIIPVMSRQLQLHESALQGGGGHTGGLTQEGGGMRAHGPSARGETDKISVSDNDLATCSEDECDTTTEDSDEDSGEDREDDGVRNIKFGQDAQSLTVADIEAELGNQLQAMARQDMQDPLGQVRVVSVHAMGGVQAEPLEDDAHDIQVIDEGTLEQVDAHPPEEPPSPPEQDDGTDSDDVDSDDSDDSGDDPGDAEEHEPPPEEPVKVVPVPSKPAKVDYSKMSVAALKEIVVGQGITSASGAAKLKKKNLLELLK